MTVAKTTLDSKASLVGNVPCVLTLLLEEGLSPVCVTPLGEDNWKLPPGLSWTLPRIPSPLTDFTVLVLL